MLGSGRPPGPARPSQLSDCFWKETYSSIINWCRPGFLHRLHITAARQDTTSFNVEVDWKWSTPQRTSFHNTSKRKEGVCAFGTRRLPLLNRHKLRGTRFLFPCCDGPPRAHRLRSNEWGRQRRRPQSPARVTAGRLSVRLWPPCVACHV